MKTTSNNKKTKSNNGTAKDKATEKKSTIPFYRRESVQFIVGLILTFAGIFIFISLVSFFFTGDADQSRVENLSIGQLFKMNNEIENWTGTLGAVTSNLLINRWIGLSAFIFTAWLCIAGLRLMRVNQANMWRTTVYCLLTSIIVSVFFGFLYITMGIDSFLSWGGNHGYVAAQYLHSFIGPWGTAMIIIILVVTLLVMISRSTIDFIRKALKTNPFNNPFKESTPAAIQPADATTASANADEEDKSSDEKAEIPFTEPEPGLFTFVNDSLDLNSTTDHNEENHAPKDDNGNQAESAPTLPPNEISLQKPESKNEMTIDVPAVLSGEGEPLFTVSTGSKEELLDEVISEEYDPTLDLPRYHKPTLDLLNDITAKQNVVDITELESNKQRITDTLQTFGIEISSIQATVGPTVTLYEIIPAPGVRISKIKNLEDDIALSLAALGIRIIAPIPGKGTVGIEVPNNDPQTVSIRSIIASRKFQECKYELPIALGKTITNEVFIADLTKMPHVLVAGATGQGKSVGLNVIITSLLYKKHPAELKLILIDPKKVEFGIYADIKRHFLAKLPDSEDAIITDVTQVVQTLQSVTREMDMRYDLLKEAHVRTIKEYNAKFKARHLLPSKGHRFLPYIVVIIDEFSDLIITAGKEVESPIIRIAQLARAVGIHMIISTQRPSTNVITGIIKANFPARIAFRVQAMVDSRTILDSPGANQLIGRGDMLISQGGEMVRVQCAFIDTPEVEKVCNYISEQQGYSDAMLLPEYIPENNDSSNGGSSIETKERDPLFEEAARFIVSNQQASTSSLQRRYSIGYNRAGRLMDQIEAAGIVGPAMGGKPREVLIMDLMQLENKLDTMK